MLFHKKCVIIFVKSNSDNHRDVV